MVLGFYFTIFILGLFIFAECTCKDLINVNGVGNCQGTKSPELGDRLACYVNQPSSCRDLLDSGTNPGEKYSAEACVQKGNLIYFSNL